MSLRVSEVPLHGCQSMFTSLRTKANVRDDLDLLPGSALVHILPGILLC
jgi:hypothetical protein